MKTALSIFRWLAYEQARAQLRVIGYLTVYLLIAALFSYKSFGGNWEEAMQQPEILVPVFFSWIFIWLVGVNTLIRNLTWWVRLPITRLQLALQFVVLTLVSWLLPLLSFFVLASPSFVAIAHNWGSPTSPAFKTDYNLTDALTFLGWALILVYISFIFAAGLGAESEAGTLGSRGPYFKKRSIASNFIQFIIKDPWSALPFFIILGVLFSGVGSSVLKILVLTSLLALNQARETIPVRFHFPRNLRSRWHTFSTAVIVLPLAGFIFWGAEIGKSPDLSFRDQIEITDWLGADVRASLGSPLTLEHLKHGLQEVKTSDDARSAFQKYLDQVEPDEIRKKAASKAGLSLAWIQGQGLPPVVLQTYLKHYAQLDQLSLNELEVFLNDPSSGIDQLENEDIAQIAMRFPDAGGVQKWLSRAQTRSALSIGLLAASSWGVHAELARFVREQVAQWEKQHDVTIAYHALEVMSLLEGSPLLLSALPDLSRTPASLVGPLPEQLDPASAPLAARPAPEAIECGELKKFAWVSGSPATQNICARIFARTQKDATLLSSLNTKWLTSGEIQSRMKRYLPKKQEVQM